MCCHVAKCAQVEPSVSLSLNNNLKAAEIEPGSHGLVCTWRTLLLQMYPACILILTSELVCVQLQVLAQLAALEDLADAHPL
jgi:hypothetical protein